MSTLEFDKLICYKDLIHAETLPKNLIALISNTGKQWITNLLKIHDAHKNPVIKSPLAKNVEIEGPVYIGENVKIEPGVYIKGPAFISANSELRHTSYIREFSYIGEKCVVGHATEVKHSFFFDGAKASHFAYVGNSILGKNVNIGAGTITCNYDGKKKNKTKILDGAFIGSNTALVAPIKIGKKSVVGAGSALTKNVKNKSLALTRANQIEVKNYKRK